MFLPLTEIIADWNRGDSIFHEKPIVINTTRIVSIREIKLMSKCQCTELNLDNAIICVKEDLNFFRGILVQ